MNPDPHLPVSSGSLAAELAAIKARLDTLDQRVSATAAEILSQLPLIVSEVLESQANDPFIAAYHQASISTAEYILAKMTGARLFRTLGIVKRGADQKARMDLLSHAFAQQKWAGQILEFGVHTGGTINHLATLTSQILHGFDSFEGLPEDWFFEIEKSTFDLKGRLPAVAPNVRLVPGWFDRTLAEFLLQHGGPVSFLHVDCDLYRSTHTILTLLGPRIQTGTIIVFDEYFNYPGWQQGEFKAFQDFVNLNNLRYKYIGYTTQWYSVAVEIL